jgi:hypothetical protein
MARFPLVLAAALGLSACAEDFGYVYSYDPYLGPRGHYVTLLHSPPPACGGLTFVGPFNEGDYRGEHLSGPYCAPPPRP